MKTPVTITAVHVNIAYTTAKLHGRAKVSVEIDGKGVEIVNELFEPGSFHISHIVEGAGILQRANNTRGKKAK
jgi:spore germination protein GerM